MVRQFYGKMHMTDLNIFFECTECKSRFWMGNTVGQTRELTSEENAFIDRYTNKAF